MKPLISHHAALYIVDPLCVIALICIIMIGITAQRHHDKPNIRMRLFRWLFGLMYAFFGVMVTNIAEGRIRLQTLPEWASVLSFISLITLCHYAYYHISKEEKNTTRSS